MLLKMFHPAMLLYVAGVVAVNLGFSYVPMFETPIGMVSPMAVVVGAIFVLRDFAQRAAGHGVLVAMLVATILSYLLADPFVATASALAFALSELVDWLVYSATKKPFHERILWSSVISTPVDTAVFLLAIGGFTTGTFVLMVLSKMIVALIVWSHGRWRDANMDDAWSTHAQKPHY